MRLLAIFAHPDDELGCIGTLRKHAERGDDVMLAWTTHGELASQFREETEEEIRRVRQEHGAWVASKIGAQHHFFNMGDSRMRGDRAEALELARLYARFKPDAVITWSDDHPHPDHRMTARIAFDAITLARIPKIINEGVPEVLEPHRTPIRFFQYMSSASGQPLIHVEITAQIDLATKVFTFYQRFYGWDYTSEQYRASRATFGREAGVAYAEKLQLRAPYLPARAFLP
jgi:LmbE family N-acetylglucosaminyl deacetylase